MLYDKQNDRFTQSQTAQIVNTAHKSPPVREINSLCFKPAAAFAQMCAVGAREAFIYIYIYVAVEKRREATYRGGEKEIGNRKRCGD